MTPAERDAFLDALPVEAIPGAIAFLAAKQMAAPAISAPIVPDELLTAGQAAKLLHTSRKFVYNHARALGAMRLGKGERARIRFRRSAILARVAR